MAAKRWIQTCSVVLVSVLLLTLNVVGLEAQLLRQRPSGRGSGSSPPKLAFGARVGRDFREDVWTAGAQMRFELPVLPGLEMLPSGDLLLDDNNDEWQLNLDAALQVLPFAYMGAGFAIANDSLPTSSGPTMETGYNMFVGFNIPMLRLPIAPFAEARWTTINRLVRPFRAVVGLNAVLGRP